MTAIFRSRYLCGLVLSLLLSLSWTFAQPINTPSSPSSTTPDTTSSPDTSTPSHEMSSQDASSDDDTANSNIANNASDDLSDTSVGPLATGEIPEQVSDQAVRSWQERAGAFDYIALANASPAAMCNQLSVLGQDPRVIRNVTINFDDRRLLDDAGIDPGVLEAEAVRRYSYSARVGEGTVARVEVLLAQRSNVWQSENVRIRFDDSTISLPAPLRANAAGIGFLLLSAYVVYLLVRPSWFRRVLAAGWQVIRGHKRIVIGTIIALYGMYGLGSLAGVSLPECQVALASLVGGSLEDIGILDVLANNNIAQTAAAITYWNFVQGTLTTTLFPAVLFAIPAYLLNISRFFVLGFALAPVGPQAGLLLFHIPVIVIELMAYTLVTAGGGILLRTIVKRGFGNIRLAINNLMLMVPIAFLLLVIGAWYESIEILWLLPMLMTP
ncbi:MAG: hypothetical protein AAF267_21545 [Deinococcota bacterium]